MALKLFAVSVISVVAHGLVSLYITFAHPGGESNEDQPKTFAARTNELVDEHVLAKQPRSAKSGLLHDLEISLVGLAALLPVLSFGARAWLSAFEFPRSRNLFRAKSRALQQSSETLHRFAQSAENLTVPPMLKSSKPIAVLMQKILQTEQFMIGEHREWCRLQTEAEWYF